MFKAINIDKQTPIKNYGEKSQMFAIAERILTRTFSNLTLGLNMAIPFKSMGFNELQGFANTIARNLSQYDSDPNHSRLFDTVSWIAAHKKVFDDGAVSFQKAHQIARKFQLIDSSERDIVKNPINVMSKRYLGQEQTMQMGNWVTDNYARVLGMVAQMIYDGSWDAYVYDEQTGEFVYDQKKDRRFYDENGNQKTENGEHAIMREVYDSNVANGIEANPIDKMTWGYSIVEMKRMKWYADVYIVGAMTDDVRPFATQQMGIRSLVQFRLFSFARLNRFGIGASSTSTILGTGYKAIKDENGEWISIREQREFETTLRSLREGMRDLVKYRSGAWKQMTEERRTNLTRIGVQAGLIGILFAVMAALKPEDEEWGKYMKKVHFKYKWIYYDMIDFMVLTEIYKSPIPSLSLPIDIYNVIFGDKKLKDLLRYMPAMNTYKSTKNLMPEDVREDVEEYFEGEETEKDK